MTTRTALVTGACGGIGRALCTAFEGAGYLVIATDRRAHDGHGWIKADLAAIARGGAALDDFVARVHSELPDGRLTALVNNGAIQHLAPLDTLPLDLWHESLDVNLTAPFLLAQRLLPALEAAGGIVLNISSIHASLTKPGFVAYATSKAALAGLTRALAVELGSRVRANALLPAAVATEMLLEGFRDRPDALAALAAMHPVGRLGTPAEVAAAAVFLASDEARFISGACWSIDGAIGARLHDPV